MFVMNMLTPFKEDDMALAMVPCGSLGQICTSWLDHYVTTNGRFADVVAVLFCVFLGKTAFNVCNALMFGLMAHLLSLLATGRRSVMVLSLWLAFVGCCFPIPGETMLWLAGSCNYLWGITASLLLTHYLLTTHHRRLTVARAVVLMTAAMVAGCFNEATSFGFLGGYVLYGVCNRRQINRRTVVAVLGYLLGVLIIVASPGIWDRVSMGEVVLDLSPGELLSMRWQILSGHMVRFITPALAVLVGLAVCFSSHRKDVKQSLWPYVFLCMLVVMFALGVPHDRAYAPMATIAFLIVARPVHLILGQRRRLRAAVVLLALAAAGWACAHALHDVKAYKTIEDGILAEIRQAPRQAVLHERHIGLNWRFVRPLPFVSSGFFWREDVYCDYFDKDNVQFVSDSIYDRYHSGRLLEGAKVMPLTTDRPDIADTVLAFDDQDYMVVMANVDTLPHTLQQAEYQIAVDVNKLNAKQRAHHQQHGMPVRSKSCGFYPLYYQGHLLWIFPPVDEKIERVVFPIDHKLPATEVTITWRQEDDSKS